MRNDGPVKSYCIVCSTVKLGFKERLNKEQLGNSETFPVTNMSVQLINSEQIGISEQLFDGPITKFDCTLIYLLS